MDRSRARRAATRCGARLLCAQHAPIACPRGNRIRRRSVPLLRPLARGVAGQHGRLHPAVDDSELVAARSLRTAPAASPLDDRDAGAAVDHAHHHRTRSRAGTSADRTAFSGIRTTRSSARKSQYFRSRSRQSRSQSFSRFSTRRCSRGGSAPKSAPCSNPRLQQHPGHQLRLTKAIRPWHGNSRQFSKASPIRRQHSCAYRRPS